MDNRFKRLSEMFSEMRFFDVDEVANIIKIHFTSWRNDEVNKGGNMALINRRQKILDEIKFLQMERSAIECQLLIAKSALKEGKEVDTVWMARANHAYRIRAHQIVSLEGELQLIRVAEKSERVKEAQNEDRLIAKEYFLLLKERFGEDYAIEMSKEINRRLGIK